MYIRTLLFVSLLTSTAWAQEFRLLPGELKLDGQEARHRILLERTDGDIAVGPVTDGVQLSTDNETIARIDAGVLIPVGNGETVVRAFVDGKEVATAKIVVTNTDKRFHWSFRNHVQAVFAKQGCNGGACHGALAGKGGFRLSLNGYNTNQDHFNITTQQFGRRVDLTEPALSLLLTKPTTAVPHKGGHRLDVDSVHYRAIVEWIADGAPASKDTDASLHHLTVLPKQATLTVGQKQPFIVQAHYSDGRVEDVTQWAKFTSANEAVATVDNDGVATVIGPGEGAVSVWFGSQIVIARMTSPYDQEIGPDSYLLTCLLYTSPSPRD